MTFRTITLAFALVFPIYVLFKFLYEALQGPVLSFEVDRRIFSYSFGISFILSILAGKLAPRLFGLEYHIHSIDAEQMHLEITSDAIDQQETVEVWRPRSGAIRDTLISIALAIFFFVVLLNVPALHHKIACLIVMMICAALAAFSFRSLKTFLVKINGECIHDRTKWSYRYIRWEKVRTPE